MPQFLLTTDTDNFQSYFWLRDSLTRIRMNDIVTVGGYVLRNSELQNRHPLNIADMAFDPDMDLDAVDGVLYLPADVDLTKSPNLKEQILQKWEDNRWEVLGLNGGDEGKDNGYGWLFRFGNNTGVHENVSWIYPLPTHYHDILYPQVDLEEGDNAILRKKFTQRTSDTMGITWIVGMPTSGASYLSGMLAGLGWETNDVLQQFDKKSEWTPERTFFDDIFTVKCMNAMNAANGNVDQLRLIKQRYRDYINELRHRIPNKFFMKAYAMAGRLFCKISFIPFSVDRVIYVDSDYEEMEKQIIGLTRARNGLDGAYKYVIKENYDMQKLWLEESARNYFTISKAEMKEGTESTILRLSQYLGQDISVDYFKRCMSVIR